MAKTFMEILQKLSPAETYLLLEGNHAKYKTAVALTFMDLLLKEVFTVIVREAKSDTPNETPEKQYLVVTGRNFENYKPLLHEKSFVKFFEKDSKLEVPLPTLAKKAYLNALSTQQYMDKVRKIHLANYYPQGLFQGMFGKKQIDQKREAFVKEIKSFFEKLGSKLSQNSNNDSIEVLHLISQIRGNVLLIQNFNFQLLQNSPFDDIKELFSSYFESQNIENEFQRRQLERQEMLEELIFTLEDMMEAFAESMDSSDSSNDSDSSSDSDSSGGDSGGDSGCSGCGGGGCGGGGGD